MKTAEWKQIYAGYGVNYNQELHDRIERSLQSELKQSLTASQGECGRLAQEIETITTKNSEAVQKLVDGMQELKRENERLQKKLKRSKQLEACCHCGTLMSQHNIGDGHSPVPMLEMCPYAEELSETKQQLTAANATIAGLRDALKDQCCQTAYYNGQSGLTKSPNAHLEGHQGQRWWDYATSKTQQALSQPNAAADDKKENK